jgi:hypothetical protein
MLRKCGGPVGSRLVKLVNPDFGIALSLAVVQAVRLLGRLQHVYRFLPE